MKRGRTEEDTSPSGSLWHPFRADFNDHFETSVMALQDIMVVVQQLRQLVRPSAPENFIVYDPYYCAGTVVQHWNTLGVQRVIHENRDFYKDIEDDKVPHEYDMLITNPPFSGDHIERMFSYLVGAKKPFAFLVPDYTATKEWYKTAVRRHFTAAPPTGKGDINAPRRTRPTIPAAVLQPPPFLKMVATDEEEENDNDNHQGDHEKKKEEGGSHGDGSSGNTSSSGKNNSNNTSVVLPIGTEPFYLVPRVRYDFKHPKGVGNEHSHFRSMWFVWAGRHTMEVLRGAKVEFLRRQHETTTRVPTPHVVHGLDALAEGHHLQLMPRPNPQRRAKQRHPRS
ncbi:uncharacterized protein TM35_000161270 [Trypanosoma theileri]|uniref:Methyltransferase n=1 Tax=Trypanosoma theileri TaxID=67003 RepID=A0A1X0NWB1_9TRYP|nr:uncharacterized protein TM35_000161270 [Trypanosoma theileri]ORC88489.1 hypothetical protein TM35_000161270 [Trypanosoma theileri]